MSKVELIDGLQAENQDWEALLGQIGEARMEQPGVAGEWTIKDVVAHLAGWRRRTVARLRAAREGEHAPRLPWPAHLQTDDEINAWLYEASRDRPLAEVLAESRQVFREMVAALEAFSEAELSEPGRFHWLEGEPLSASSFFAHFHQEHEPDMRAWLARQEAR